MGKGIPPRLTVAEFIKKLASAAGVEIEAAKTTLVDGLGFTTVYTVKRVIGSKKVSYPIQTFNENEPIGFITAIGICETLEIDPKTLLPYIPDGPT